MMVPCPASTAAGRGAHRVRSPRCSSTGRRPSAANSLRVKAMTELAAPLFSWWRPVVKQCSHNDDAALTRSQHTFGLSFTFGPVGASGVRHEPRFFSRPPP